LGAEDEAPDSGANGRAQLVPSSVLAELEEGVPVEVIGGLRACAGGGSFWGGRRRCAD